MRVIYNKLYILKLYKYDATLVFFFNIKSDKNWMEYWNLLWFFVFLQFFFHFFTIIFFFSTKHFCIFYNEYSIILLCIYNDSTSSLGGTFEPPFSTFEPWVRLLVLHSVLLNLEYNIWSSTQYFWTFSVTFGPPYGTFEPWERLLDHDCQLLNLYI